MPIEMPACSQGCTLRSIGLGSRSARRGMEVPGRIRYAWLCTKPSWPDHRKSDSWLSLPDPSWGGETCRQAQSNSSKGGPPGDRMLGDGERPLQLRRLGQRNGPLFRSACAQQQMPPVLERRASQCERERRSLLLREVALKTGIVGIDEFTQSLHAFKRGAKRGEG